MVSTLFRVAGLATTRSEANDNTPTWAVVVLGALVLGIGVAILARPRGWDAIRRKLWLFSNTSYDDWYGTPTSGKARAWSYVEGGFLVLWGLAVILLSGFG